MSDFNDYYYTKTVKKETHKEKRLRLCLIQARKRTLKNRLKKYQKIHICNDEMWNELVNGLESHEHKQFTIEIIKRTKFTPQQYILLIDKYFNLIV